MESTRIYIYNLQSSMETIFLKNLDQRNQKPFARNAVSQGENGQTGSERRPISFHATTIFKLAISVSLKKKKREKERLEMESTCCAITQSHGSLHRPRNRNPGRVDVISRASGKFADRVDSNICRIMERNRVCVYI